MSSSHYHQIIDLKKRRGKNTPFGLEFEIQHLREKAEAAKKFGLNFDEFITIRLVTILEVFVRDTISDLTNSREEFFERGEQLVKGSRIDLAFVAHVNRRELTIGDFIAHSVSLNSIAAIISVLDKLLENFTAKLKVAHPRWTEDVNEWPLPPIVKDFDTMMASLARLFETRHVLTHELPQMPVLDPDDMSEFTAAAAAFIEATNWVVLEALRGAVPRTQTEMNNCAFDDLRLEEARLAATLSEVEALASINLEALHALQEGWNRWADAQADLVASQVEGGSMGPGLWAYEKTTLVQDRIDQLLLFKKHWAIG